MVSGTQCQKCGGNLITSYERTSCLQCGHSPMTQHERLIWYAGHKQEMIEDLQRLGDRAVIKKWNLTHQMISHLKVDPLYPGKRDKKPAAGRPPKPATIIKADPRDGSHVFLAITDEDLIALDHTDTQKAFDLYRSIYFHQLKKRTGGATNG
jgi:hypothetical protein